MTALTMYDLHFDISNSFFTFHIPQMLINIAWNQQFQDNAQQQQQNIWFEEWSKKKTMQHNTAPW